MLHHKRSESGIALLLALFALVVVTSIGLGMMFLTDTETSIDSNFRDQQTAYYSSKAGLEEARDRMRPAATNSINASGASNLPTAKPGATNGVLYVLNPKNSETVAPWTSTNAYFDDEFCKEYSSSCNSATPPVPTAASWYIGPGLSVSTPTLTASTTYAASPVLPYKWMRVTLKLDQSAAGTSNVMYVDANSTNASNYVCWNGINEISSSTACALPNVPVYELTTLSVTPSGTRRMLQYEVTQDSLNLGLPAALTLEGPFNKATDWSSPGSGFVATGNNPSVGSNAGNVPNCAGSTNYAMAAQGSTSTTSLTSAATPVTNFPGLGGTSTTASVTDASTALTTDKLDTVAGLNNLVATIKGMADETDTDCSSANLGSAAVPRIVVIDNSAATSTTCNISGNPATPGNGILLITNSNPSGTLTQLNFADNPYNGIILIIGPGAYFDQQSAKNTHFAGEMLIANTKGSPAGTLGDPKFSWHSGAGTLAAPSIQYDSCLVSQDSFLKDYRVVASHELMY